MGNGNRSDLSALIGQRFGTRTVTGVEIATPGGRKTQRLTLRCDCGRPGSALAFDLAHGKAKGCLSCGSGMRTHGEAKKTAEWTAWSSMHSRCGQPSHSRYARYGGRGITVCARWSGEGGFQNFLSDLGRRPSSRHSLGRIDNDGNYTPENCRWETPEQQGANTIRTRLLTIDGETLSMSEWSRRSGTNLGTLRARLARGLDHKAAVFGPARSGDPS